MNACGNWTRFILPTHMTPHPLPGSSRVCCFSRIEESIQRMRDTYALYTRTKSHDRTAVYYLLKLLPVVTCAAAANSHNHITRKNYANYLPGLNARCVQPPAWLTPTQCRQFRWDSPTATRRRITCRRCSSSVQHPTNRACFEYRKRYFCYCGRCDNTTGQWKRLPFPRSFGSVSLACDSSCTIKLYPV
jgi:hypothetical protein